MFEVSEFFEVSGVCEVFDVFEVFVFSLSCHPLGVFEVGTLDWFNKNQHADLSR